ncbi:MAG: LuxR C-terminal-related transcriptional regulator [Bacteroidia bacterium]
MNSLQINNAFKIWNKISIGEIVQSKEFELEVKNKLLSVFQVGDFYYFIFNIKELTLGFISNEVESVLGYKPEELDLIKMMSLIHPMDYPWFLNFENKVIEFYSKLKLEQFLNYKVRYDYRIQKKNGDYLRILQQIIVIDYSAEGGILKTFGLHTDISHIKENGNPMLSFIGLNGEPSFINVEIEKVFPIPSEFLSTRETEILSMLIDGKISKQIAEELSISIETVSTHRKNMLKKTNAKNTSDLIAKAILNGWV